MSRLSFPLIAVAAFALAACAATDPAAGVDAASCALTDEELAEVQAAAMAYLAEEWPVADRNCEEISAQVTAVAPGKCAIAGAAKLAAGCAEPAHEGFSVVFDRATLEPEAVHFKTE